MQCIKGVCFSSWSQCKTSPVVTRPDIDIYMQMIPSSAGTCQRGIGWMFASLLRLIGPTELPLTPYNVLPLQRGRTALPSTFALLPATCTRRAVAHLRLSTVTSVWDAVTPSAQGISRELGGEDCCSVWSKGGQQETHPSSSHFVFTHMACSYLQNEIWHSGICACLHVLDAHI